MSKDELQDLKDRLADLNPTKGGSRRAHNDGGVGRGREAGRPTEIPRSAGKISSCGPGVRYRKLTCFLSLAA
jgi:hypothetical protein